jgi:hypothetical protein
VAAILDFRSQKKHKICRGPSNDYPFNILDLRLLITPLVS